MKYCKYCTIFVFVVGVLHPNRDRRINQVQNEGLNTAVIIPCPLLPTTPPSATINPTRPCLHTLHFNSGGQQSRPNTVPASPYKLNPASEEKDEVSEREPQPAVASIAASDSKLHFRPAGTDCVSPLTPVASHESLSDLSRPPSSLFCRSTSLASGRISVLSGKTSTVTVVLVLTTGFH